MVSSWGGIPKGLVPAPKHHQVAGPERPAGAGEGGQPSFSPQTALLHKEPFQSYWLAGLLRLFFFGACVLNTNQVASLGCHTNWPQSPRKCYRVREGPSDPAASVQASRWETPRSPAGSPTKVGHQHPSSSAEPFQSGVVQRNHLK